MVRGSGAAWDLRRAQPYECYAELDFDIPDRQERRLLRPLPHAHGRDAPVGQDHEAVHRKERPRAGPVSSTDNKVVPPKRAEMKRSMEALIHHFKLYTEGYHVPAGEVYAAVEAQGRVRRLSGRRRQQQALSLQDPRAGLRASAGDGFHLPGHMLADVSAILGSLDIVFGEVDR